MLTNDDGWADCWCWGPSGRNEPEAAVVADGRSGGDKCCSWSRDSCGSSSLRSALKEDSA